MQFTFDGSDQEFNTLIGARSREQSGKYDLFRELMQYNSFDVFASIPRTHTPVDPVQRLLPASNQALLPAAHSDTPIQPKTVFEEELVFNTPTRINPRLQELNSAYTQQQSSETTRVEPVDNPYTSSSSEIVPTQVSLPVTSKKSFLAREDWNWMDIAIVGMILIICGLTLPRVLPFSHW